MPRGKRREPKKERPAMMVPPTMSITRGTSSRGPRKKRRAAGTRMGRSMGTVRAKRGEVARCLSRGTKVEAGTMPTLSSVLFPIVTLLLR